MEELKKQRQKHDHKGTKILKLIIFSCVMLAPFFSILTRCLYVLNPNAKDSYFGETINQYDNIVVREFSELNTNTTYYYYNNYVEFEVNVNKVIYVSDVNIIINNSNVELDNNDIKAFRTTYYSGYSYTIFYHNDMTAYTGIRSSEYEIYFSFRYISNDFTTENLQARFNGNITYHIYNKYSYLDNAFEYSLENLAKSNYYNWTQNTGIYTGINSMCTGLGVNNVIAILLTYWALCTCIYIVFDIVIELFTKITHFINAD